MMETTPGKPNLFGIATKELSHDAFITWLLKWANPACKQLDAGLQECGLAFLQMLTGEKAILGNEEIRYIDADRQWDNIDIWAELFFHNERKILVIIENKTFSHEHSNQLERYKKQATDYCTEHGYELICIYLKIGSEPVNALDRIREKGFTTITRQEILHCLTGFKGINNAIVNDYIDNLELLEQAHRAFETSLPANWKGFSWVGFFQFVESRINIVTWHYVNNQSGGFWNLCLTWKYWFDVPVYMQIEEETICYKIALGEEETELDNKLTEVDKIQDFVYKTLMEFAAKEDHAEIRRPGSFVHRGNYRTLANIDQLYWMGDPNKPLDKEAVIKKLQEILHFYQEFMNHLNTISYADAGIKVVHEGSEDE